MAKQLWVAGGSYTPAPPNGNRNLGFTIPSNAAIYGGFAGGEASLALRDFDANRTILSGDLNGDDNTVGNAENSKLIVSFFDEGSLLDGVTVTSGNGGAVIRGNASSAWGIIRNSRVVDNAHFNHSVSEHILFGTAQGALSVYNSQFPF